MTDDSTGFPAPRAHLARLIITVMVGLAGGALGNYVGIPLPWMLGSFICCAVLSIVGVHLVGLPGGRETGQLMVGVAIGMRLTAATWATTLSLLPAMFVGTLFVVAMTMGAALLLMALTGIDQRTAFFATAAAGMAEMANVAQQHGGDPDVVSLMHAIRVASVVAIVPLLVVAFGNPGHVLPPGEAAVSLPLLLLALCMAWLAALALRHSPVPNPWLVGPIFLGAALSGSGLLTVTVPGKLIVVAQLLIGISLGVRFKRDLLLRLPRMVVAGLAVSAYMIISSAGAAWVLAALSGLPYVTSFLAMAPAAVTEMVITAKVMNLDTEIVAAFHVMRIALIASTILLSFALFEWLTSLWQGTRG